jgi:hypothetical protein
MGQKIKEFWDLMRNREGTFQLESSRFRCEKNIKTQNA